MSDKQGPKPPADLNREAQAIWDKNAAFWDGRMQDGNAFQRLLIGPAAERLLAVQPGEEVLEIACGNGVFARRLAALGARVLATDFSAQMLAHARARTVENAERIEYRQLDATDEAAIVALGAARFPAAVCNMGLMDMAEIEPFFRGLSQVLRPGGRLVFSVMHPCFNNPAGCRMMAEEEDREGEIIDSYSIRVSRYITPTVARGLGMIGQPVPQLYFHRPLSVLLAPAFCAGFALDGLEEPVFGPGAPSRRALDWANYLEIPPVLVARLRLL